MKEYNNTKNVNNSDISEKNKILGLGGGNKKNLLIIILVILLIIIIGIASTIIIKNSNEQRENIELKSTNQISKEKTISQNQVIDITSIFKGFKNLKYRGTIKNKNSEEWCELEFDSNGKPNINMGYKNENVTESYGTANEFTNIKQDVAAGTTYITFDFKGWSADGNGSSGSGTISYSNVVEDKSMTVTLKYSNGINKTIIVREIVNGEKTQEQTISQNQVIDITSIFKEFKNLKYRGTIKNKNSEEWCELEFDSNGKPNINMGYKNENVTESYGTANEFTNIKQDVAAGTTYITFDFKGWSADGNGSSGSGTISYSNVFEDKSMTITLKYSNGVEKTIIVAR